MVNNSGKVQPILKSFFGVEMGSTSFAVAKAILDERYGGELSHQWTSNQNLLYRVYWYDQPVTAYFTFELSGGKYVLDQINISCEESIVKYIVDRLNRDYGKDTYDDGTYFGYWGAPAIGQKHYAIETDGYSDNNSRIVYRGFIIRAK